MGKRQFVFYSLLLTPYSLLPIKMSAETTALAALKTILEGINPDPEPAPTHVWVYPADYEQIKFNELPVIIVSRIVNRPVNMNRLTPLGGQHQWPIEVAVFLTPGPLMDDKQAALAEIKVSPWPIAMSTLLFPKQNQNFNGTVQAIGDGEKFFTYQVGHIHFWTNVFWGIRFEILAKQ